MERPFKIIWIVIISFVSVVPLFLLAHNFPEDYLIPHNNARAEVKVKPLNWDPQLASHARKFVEKHSADCKTGYLDESLASTYGQNYAYNPTSETGAKAVAGWVKQKYKYDYKSNSCIDGTVECHCYTQIVWSSTTRLGCASVKCHNFGGTLTTCLYYPHGNLPNQRPYKIH